MEPAERTRLLLARTLALLLLPCANAFAPQLVSRLFSRPVMRYRGGAAAAMSEEPFPVISRFVGGTVEWEVDGENCTTTLTAGERKVTLRGQHIGGGVVKFDAMGLPFEYKFHQVGRDTLLVSRTEDSSCAECGQGEEAVATRLDCGSIVLTGTDSCVQTILHLEDRKLTQTEIIHGVRTS